MPGTMSKEEIFKKISAVGRAALTLEIQNSHSGNISLACVDENGEPALAITATGAQKGELTRDKICYPSLKETNYGYFKASTETDIHARVLQLPGVQATMHCHTKTATIVTMDDAPRPKQNPRPPLVPLDELGQRYLGEEVPVDWVEVASGSKEMAEIISARLGQGPACIIQEHGAFARGASVEETLFYLNIVEHSGKVIFYAEILGVDMDAARGQARSLRPELMKEMPDYSISQDHQVDFADEPETVEMFLTQGFRIFESRYSPFHTGSMSLRGAETMLYLPKASLPHDLPGPMREVSLEQTLLDSPAMNMHRRIYRETPLKALVHCHLPETQAVALHARPGRSMAKVLPIDVEGGFLYPAIPVLPPQPDPEELIDALLNYRIVIVSFGGVWAGGEQSVGEAIRAVSSIKDICLYRIMAQLRGLDVAKMELERGRTW